MQKQSLLAGLLIVMELGAEWPNPSAAAPRRVRRVLVQNDAESPAQFAARVRSELQNISASGTALGQAVLACNERLDEPAREARAELARIVAGALGSARSAGLLLSVSNHNGDRARAAFSALQAELAREWRRIGVALKFGLGDESATALVASQSRADSRPARVKDDARSVA